MQKMSIVDKIQRDLQCLLQLETNLKKSINQKFRTETLRAKLAYATELYSEIETKLLVEEDNLSDKELKLIAKASRQTLLSIKTIIEGKLKPKMPDQLAQATFDIKTATAVISHYDGSAENLDAFIDATNLMKGLTPASQHASLIQFIKTRLTGKARLGLPAVLATVDDLIADVKKRCEEKISPDSITAKLKQLKPSNDITAITTEVEKLTDKLKSIYIGKQIPQAVAESMATKAGIDALIDKTTNLEVKIMLSAATFTSVAEAIQKINEHSARTNTAQVLKYSTNNQQRPFVKRQNQQNTQYTPNLQRNRQQYINPQNQNYRNRQNHYGNHNQNWRGRNNQFPNQYNQYNNSNSRNRRIYVAQQGNQWGPQQQQHVGDQQNSSITPQHQIQQFAQLNQIAQGQQTHPQPTIYYQNQLAQSQPRQ